MVKILLIRYVASTPSNIQRTLRGEGEGERGKGRKGERGDRSANGVLENALPEYEKRAFRLFQSIKKNKKSKKSIRRNEKVKDDGNYN